LLESVVVVIKVADGVVIKVVEIVVDVSLWQPDTSSMVKTIKAIPKVSTHFRCNFFGSILHAFLCRI
jgi:hypothetical protein